MANKTTSGLIFPTEIWIQANATGSDGGIMMPMCLPDPLRSALAPSLHVETVSMGVSLSDHQLGGYQTLACCVNPLECGSSPTFGVQASPSALHYEAQRRDGATTGDLITSSNHKASNKFYGWTALQLLVAQS